jgi:hypothetical protein
VFISRELQQNFAQVFILLMLVIDRESLRLATGPENIFGNAWGSKEGGGQGGAKARNWKWIAEEHGLFERRKLILLVTFRRKNSILSSS